MAYYILVHPTVADKICGQMTEEERNAINTTPAGNKLLWQSAIDSIEGVLLTDRVEKIGGVALTAQLARAAMDGDGEYEVTIPDEYKDAEEETAEEAPAETAEEVVDGTNTEEVE